MAVAQLHAVAKNYGAIAALRGIDLAIEPGEVVSLLGPNGAGKTTAVRILLGLVQPSSGRAEVFGHPPGQPVRPPAPRRPVAGGARARNAARARAHPTVFQLLREAPAARGNAGGGGTRRHP